ncbi:MAG: NADH-quinone oxidoreductase chain 5 [Bacteroidetes bacterium GWA2_40_15]|nr:MAG: NADH-quinone oxidoreductase chain 5 [Bacteroidetes bacterium GWA2_40_15]OFX92224.1 MAG: NADH-quinone oxidoreductase chain 5 [Bacteroidetes bacterium GWC2_40_22]HAM11445.1 NADH-quinone oxidoreductase chain 5 [Bacteroidales bacterium]HBH82940.1 NADH-quinone oxidoreductase chain 5 [Bacteroidales bacterium]HBQ83376.1 NADH-quinone oxidoreductase chain 5 [Bacteroidales bacterium]
MDKTQLGDFVKSLKPDATVIEGKQYTEVTVADTDLHSLAKKLRESEETWLDFLVCLTGVDYGDNFGVIYHLKSTKHGHMIVLKTRTSEREKPVLNSVCDIWKGAEFHEREVFDLLGVKFNNHPDLRRLFLDSSWGFPLRKDYVDDINIVSK